MQPAAGGAARHGGGRHPARGARPGRGARDPRRAARRRRAGSARVAPGAGADLERPAAGGQPQRVRRHRGAAAVSRRCHCVHDRARRRRPHPGPAAELRRRAHRELRGRRQHPGWLARRRRPFPPRLMAKSAPRRWLVGGPPLAYLLFFFAAPLLIMVVASFRGPGDFGGLAPLLSHDESGTQLNLTTEAYERFFSDFLYAGLFLKSFGYAALATLLCLAAGYPLALLVARSPRKYRDILVLLVILPFWSNFLIRVYAWMMLLGPQSFVSTALTGILGLAGLEPVSLLYTPTAVVVALVYVHLPFMVLPLYANLEKHDPALLDAAQDLGAGAWQRFWRVTFPLSLPGVYAGAALVFIPALGIFAIPDLLGGTEGIMIGNVIKQQFLDTRDWPFGAALSLMLMLSTLAVAVVRRPRGVRLPVRAARPGRGLFVQRFPAERPVGRLHLRLVRETVPERADAARGAQLAADRARRQRRVHRARHDGRLQPAPPPAATAAGAGARDHRHSGDPDGGEPADLLRAAQHHPRHGVDRARPHHLLRRLRGAGGARAPRGHGREPDRGGLRP